MRGDRGEPPGPGLAARRGRLACAGPGPRRPAALLSPAAGRHVLVHRAARPAQPVLRAALPAGAGRPEEAHGARRGAQHAAELGGRVCSRR